MRIVSLLPSATEISLSLGLGRQLVGVTFECVLPADIRATTTVVVGGRDTSELSPRQTDDYVRAQVAAGADLYTLDENALAHLAPDLILTQDLCRVCAIATDRVTDALAHLGCAAEVVTLDPNSLDDVLATIVTVGSRTGSQDRAAGLVSTLRQRLGTTAQQVDGRQRPRVAVIEWTDPVFGAGHWIPDLVEAAGGVPVACHPRTRSTTTTWQAIRGAGPDVVVVAPCGYGLAGAAAQARSIIDEVPGVPVWAIDADALVVRPGPRLVDGVEALASIFHPDAVAARPLAVTWVSR